MGDVVFVETPEVGDTIAAGDQAGVVESVKAASDIYAPIGGEVIARPTKYLRMLRRSSIPMRSTMAGFSRCSLMISVS